MSRRRRRKRTAKSRRSARPMNDETPTLAKRAGVAAAVGQLVSALVRIWHDLTS